MNKDKIEPALVMMREALEIVVKSNQEKSDAILAALQAMLRTLADIDKGSAAVLLATDFNGKMGVYTLNANKETAVAMASTLLTHLGGVSLATLPVEDIGAVQ